MKNLVCTFKFNYHDILVKNFNLFKKQLCIVFRYYWIKWISKIKCQKAATFMWNEYNDRESWKKIKNWNPIEKEQVNIDWWCKYFFINYSC